MEITKIDINKNSIPTQRHKNTRFPTPIKHRLSSEKDSLEEEKLQNNYNLFENHTDETKLEKGSNKK